MKFLIDESSPQILIIIIIIIIIRFVKFHMQNQCKTNQNHSVCYHRAQYRDHSGSEPSRENQEQCKNDRRLKNRLCSRKGKPWQLAIETEPWQDRQTSILRLLCCVSLKQRKKLQNTAT